MRTVIYANYLAAPRIVETITPVIDQTIAGALMMAMDMVVLGLDGLIILYRWFEEEEPEVGEALDRPAPER